MGICGTFSDAIWTPLFNSVRMRGIASTPILNGRDALFWMREPKGARARPGGREPTRASALQPMGLLESASKGPLILYFLRGCFVEGRDEFLVC